VFTKYLAAEEKDASVYFQLAQAYKATGGTSKLIHAIADYKKTSEAAKGACEAQRTLDTQRDQDTSSGEGDENKKNSL
jgi:predicted Zn-dependent protease